MSRQGQKRKEPDSENFSVSVPEGGDISAAQDLMDLMVFQPNKKIKTTDASSSSSSNNSSSSSNSVSTSSEVERQTDSKSDALPSVKDIRARPPKAKGNVKKRRKQSIQEPIFGEAEFNPNQFEEKEFLSFYDEFFKNKERCHEILGPFLWVEKDSRSQTLNQQLLMKELAFTHKQNDLTLLMIAAGLNWHQLTGKLLRALDENQQKQYISKRILRMDCPYNGFTAPMIAACSGSSDVLQVMLDVNAEATVNAFGVGGLYDSSTPLMCALYFIADENFHSGNRVLCAELLIKNSSPTLLKRRVTRAGEFQDYTALEFAEEFATDYPQIINLIKDKVSPQESKASKQDVLKTALPKPVQLPQLTVPVNAQQSLSL